MYTNLLSVFLSVISFTSLALGAVLYLQGGGGIASKLFAFVAALSGVWIAILVIDFYYYSTVGHSVPPFIITKTSFAAAIAIFYLFFLFTHSFPQDKMVIKKWVFIPASVVTILVMIFSFIPGAILRYDEFVPGGYMPLTSKGPVYNFLYAPLVFIFLFWGTAKLVSNYRKSKNALDRSRLSHIIIGSIISGLVGMIYDILSPHLPKPIGSLPIGHLGVFLFIALSSYAILKYKLFNVKVIATELLTFSIWAFLLVRIFISGTAKEIALDGSLLMLVVVFGIILIRSVLNEVHEREELEKTSASLADLKGNLEQKVIEQTEEVKSAYEVEKKARLELEEIDENKNKFILTTQHHLRTPLTIIKGYINILKGKPALPKEALTALDRMEISGDKLSHSVNDLLQATEVKARGKS